ncbi:MAG: PstS family phosphate ABC transporter substrate-binding protein [Chromatiales bacterium]
MIRANPKKVLGICGIVVLLGNAADSRSEITALQPYRKVDKLAGHISIATTSELATLAQNLAEEFRKYYPAVDTQLITAESNPLLDPMIDIGSLSLVLSHPVTEQDSGALERLHGHPVPGVTIAADAVAIYVHKDNPLKQLTLPQADAIFSDDRRCGYKTRILTWKDLGFSGEWASHDVLLFGSAEGTETSRYFRQAALCGGAYKGTLAERAAVGLAIEKSIYGIGFASSTASTPGVRAVPIARKGTDSIAIGQWLIESHGIPTPDTEAFEPTARQRALGQVSIGTRGVPLRAGEPVEREFTACGRVCSVDPVPRRTGSCIGTRFRSGARWHSSGWFAKARVRSRLKRIPLLGLLRISGSLGVRLDLLLD